MIASDKQSTDAILGTIAVAAHSLTGATGAAVAMPRDGVVVCVGRSGETAPELGDRLNVDSGISGECLRTGVIMRCDDASRDFHVDAEVCRQLGLQSIAVVPLRGQHGRVGVLEAFSTESYAFTEDKMEVLGRLAGLAEAAWARGAVTESPSLVTGVEAGQAEPHQIETGLVESDPVESHPVESHLESRQSTSEFAGVVEALPETGRSTVAAVPLAEVRGVLATIRHRDPSVSRKWRFAILGAVSVLAVALVSVYGWKVWYGASIASRTSRSRDGNQVSAQTGNGAAGTAAASAPDLVSPSPPSEALHSAKPAAAVKTRDEVIRRRPQPARSTVRGIADSRSLSHSVSGPNAEDIPRIASTGAASSDLGKVLSASPALPKLGAPISQGVSGGVLLHKVQPVYPPEARRMHMEGSVVIDAMVTAQGQVDNLQLVSGNPVLASAAMDAVRRWRYSPYLLNGNPIPKQTRITISFIAPQ
ncbi:MAG: TonB family protein [Terriglobales bacterium]